MTQKLNPTVVHKEASAGLVARCKKGDEAAYRQLYDMYSKAMYNICVRMLNNTGDAEDVLQESFVAAFKNIGQYSGSGSFGSWLKRIVINRCIDLIKKRNFNVLQLEFVSEDEIVTETEVPLLSIESILDGVSRLPDGYRIILTLYLFEGYSHKMIAEKLGLSEGTSKSQYSRARKKLLELLSSTK